jgi:mannose-6-phosphate isomerase-like protein (cupin superfamily)
MELVQHSARETVEAVEGVHLTPLAVGEEMSVQHVHVESDAVVPEHSHHHEQVGYVLSGSGVFVVDGERFHVSSGDSYALASNEPHSVENASEEPLEAIDVFAPPRADPDWRE